MTTPAFDVIAAMIGRAGVVSRRVERQVFDGLQWKCFTLLALLNTKEQPTDYRDAVVALYTRGTALYYIVNRLVERDLITTNAQLGIGPDRNEWLQITSRGREYFEMLAPGVEAICAEALGAVDVKSLDMMVKAIMARPCEPLKPLRDLGLSIEEIRRRTGYTYDIVRAALEAEGAYNDHGKVRS